MLDLVIMCCAEYKNLLPGCLASARRWITNKIENVTVITNLPDLRVPGVKVLRDQDLWSQISSHDLPELYRANWTRQQIFKLNLDLVSNNPVLCLDTEVRWLRYFDAVTVPQTWYTSTALGPNHYTRMITALLGVQDFYHESFITDCMLFQPGYLKQIRQDIEHVHGKHWLLVLDQLCRDSQYKLSEYELYAAWCRHRNMPMDIQNIGDQRFTLEQIGPDDEGLSERARHLTTAPYLSIAWANTSWRGRETRWLTFYEQVRGADWPEPVEEKNFGALPDWVQRECIEVHGYRPL